MKRIRQVAIGLGLLLVGYLAHPIPAHAQDGYGEKIYSELKDIESDITQLAIQEDMPPSMPSISKVPVLPGTPGAQELLVIPGKVVGFGCTQDACYVVTQ